MKLNDIMTEAVKACRPETDLAADAIAVRELLNREVFSIRPEDDVKKALRLMQEQRVRRLPVTDREGHLKGIISINDIMLAAGDRKKRDGIPTGEAMKTMQAICAHRSAEQPRLKQKLAAVS